MLDHSGWDLQDLINQSGLEARDEIPMPLSSSVYVFINPGFDFRATAALLAKQTGQQQTKIQGADIKHIHLYQALPYLFLLKHPCRLFNRTVVLLQWSKSRITAAGGTQQELMTDM